MLTGDYSFKSLHPDFIKMVLLLSGFIGVSYHFFLFLCAKQKKHEWNPNFLFKFDLCSWLSAFFFNACACFPMNQNKTAHTDAHKSRNIFFSPVCTAKQALFFSRTSPPPPPHAHFGAQQTLFSQLLTVYATCSKLLTILAVLLYRHWHKGVKSSEFVHDRFKSVNLLV